MSSQVKVSSVPCGTPWLRQVSSKACQCARNATIEDEKLLQQEANDKSGELLGTARRWVGSQNQERFPAPGLSDARDTASSSLLSIQLTGR